MTKTLVLLSTWNGSRYLPEQIESVLSQDIDSEIAILVRDDGSSDDTVRYLNGFDPRITVIEGTNLGPRGSFLALLRLAQSHAADLYALCDQDDVWRPDKLRRANAMLGQDKPGLYASSLDLVDETLRPLRRYTHPGNRSFVSTLLVNYVTGCTCVFNRRFLEELPFPADPDMVIMHDWWLASVATIGAVIHYDPESAIAYRQHASNHVGIQSGLAATCRKIRSAMTTRPAVTRFDQARALAASAGERLDAERQAILRRFLAAEHSAWRRGLFVARHRADIGWQAALRFIAFG